MSLIIPTRAGPLAGSLTLGATPTVTPAAQDLLSSIVGDTFGGQTASALFGTSTSLGLPSPSASLFGSQAQSGTAGVPGAMARGITSLASTALDAVFGSGIQGSGAAAVADTAAMFSSGPTFAQLKAGFVAKGIKDEDASMMALQEQQQRYQRLMTLMTNLMEMKHEGLKGIVQNMRA